MSGILMEEALLESSTKLKRPMHARPSQVNLYRQVPMSIRLTYSSMKLSATKISYTGAKAGRTNFHVENLEAPPHICNDMLELVSRAKLCLIWLKTNILFWFTDGSKTGPINSATQILSPPLIRISAFRPRILDKKLQRGPRKVSAITLCVLQVNESSAWLSW